MPDSNDWDNIPSFDRGKGQFRRLDLEKWLIHHDIVNQGCRRGEENQPPESQDYLDATEGQILSWINRRGRVCRENVSAYLSDLERELADIENDEELLSLGNQVSELERDGEFELEQAAKEGQDLLVGPREELTDCVRDLREFRERSGLTRPADYSQCKKAAWFISVCFFVEVLLNASLLMEVNAFGLLGSSMQMGLISFANIVIAGLGLGALLRQSNHSVRWRKTCSWVGIVALLGAVGVFNIAIGHFRDSMQAILDDPSADALYLGNDVLVRMGADLFGLQSFQSALLAVLGFLFFLLASWKWLQRDDPYPDYGRRDREIKQKRETYTSEYKRAVDGLSFVSRKRISKLEDIRHSLTAKQSRWREICRQGDRILEEYPVQLAQYQDDLNYLLDKYREANSETRTDATPRYFGTKENVVPEILVSPGFRPPAQQNIAQVTERVAAAIENLQQSRRNAGREYPNTEALCCEI